LDPQRLPEDKVTFHVEHDGCDEQLQVFTPCFVFCFAATDAVYHILYDEEIQPRGRFTEVEVDPDKVPELGIDQSCEELKQKEQLLLKLGVSPKNRFKKSLFEPVANV